MSKWLLKHYFRWNEKPNPKQFFDWIRGLCWTLLLKPSLPISTFAPWCQIHHFPDCISFLLTPSLPFPPFSFSFSVMPFLTFLPVSVPALPSLHFLTSLFLTVDPKSFFSLPWLHFPCISLLLPFHTVFFSSMWSPVLLNSFKKDGKANTPVVIKGVDVH